MGVDMGQDMGRGEGPILKWKVFSYSPRVAFSKHHLTRLDVWQFPMAVLAQNIFTQKRRYSRQLDRLCIGKALAMCWT